MKQYALISNEIMEVDDIKVNTENNEVSFTTIRFCSKMNCKTSNDNFLVGEKSYLENILIERINVFELKKSRYIETILRHLTQPLNSFELKVLDIMLDDGELDELMEKDSGTVDFYEVINSAADGIKRYMECNSSIYDAYMDYMH